MTDHERNAILAERLSRVRGRIAQACQRCGRNIRDVTLVAVTKTVSADVAALIVEHGVVDLGESRPQELWKKAQALSVVRWHLIGHLQRNKLDRTVPLTTLIHSVDSVRLLDALDAFGRKQTSPIPVLLEVNCSREVNKGGFMPEEIPALGERLVAASGLVVRGLMTMAAQADNPEDCRSTFAELRQIRDELQTRTGMRLPDLSMGMSHDFEVAIEEGATLVRVGTTLFEGLGESPS